MLAKEIREKAQCPVCRRQIAVQPNGKLYHHRVAEHLPPRRTYVCQGSGGPPLGEWPLQHTS